MGRNDGMGRQIKTSGKTGLFAVKRQENDAAFRLDLAGLQCLGHSQQTRCRRIVVIGPINSNELEILKSYTTQNGIVLLQLFSK